MKIIIYDCNDDAALHILKTIRPSAPSHAKLIPAEFLIQEDGKAAKPISGPTV